MRSAFSDAFRKRLIAVILTEGCETKIPHPGCQCHFNESPLLNKDAFDPNTVILGNMMSKLNIQQSEITLT